MVNLRVYLDLRLPTDLPGLQDYDHDAFEEQQDQPSIPCTLLLGDPVLQCSGNPSLHRWSRTWKEVA